MTLRTKLLRIYLGTMIGSLVLAISLYFTLAYAHKRQMLDEAHSYLEALSESQMSLILQEFVNDRFYAAVIRGKAIFNENQKDGLQVAFYRSDGTALYESENFKSINNPPSQSWLSLDSAEYVTVDKPIEFAGSLLGRVVFAKRLDLRSQRILTGGLALAMTILGFSLLVLFIVMHLSFSRLVLRPIQLVSDSIPNIGNYLNDMSNKLHFPKSLGSKEWDHVAATVESMTLQLKDALMRQRDAQIEVEKQAAAAQIARQVAHDIRSPLSALRILTASLASIGSEEKKLIQIAISRIQDIANDLLRRHQSEQLSLNAARQGSPAEISAQFLPGLIDSMVTEKRIQYRAQSGISIEFKEIDSHSLFAKLDPLKFRRVLSNIINNAVESISSTGKVIIALLGTDDDIQIRISDTGKGIPANLIPHLGQQGESFGKIEGSGLGLYHARTTVESWGGRIAILSSVGVGSTVTIHLPKASEPVWFAKEIIVPSKSGIVILDDDPTVHEGWDQRLSSLPDVREIPRHHFSSVKEVLDWHRKQDWKNELYLYLIDYEIAGETTTGLDLIEALKIEPNSYLVTNAYDDVSVHQRCAASHIKLVPKFYASTTTISFTFRTQMSRR